MNLSLKSLYKQLLLIGLISCLGIIVYSDSFLCSFHLDDTASIVKNLFIRNIQDLQGIWNFWPCRFITYLSFALNYHFSGPNVVSYHLFNVTIHVVSAILVWWLTLLTFSTPVMKGNKISQHGGSIALLAGLIFVSHPIQTEAVTYIVQRASSMAALFYLASLCFYIKSRLPLQPPGLKRFLLSGKDIFYISSLIMAIMAMFTKETAITLPLMILLYEYSFLRINNSFNWKPIVPFLGTLMIIPLTMFLTKSVNFQEMHRINEPSSGISPLQYLLTQLRVMVTYIRLAFLPFNQNIDYDYPVFKNIFELPVLGSIIFLTAILFWAKRMFSKYRLLSFSIFWFFLALLPESSLLPIRDVIFEHRLYLSLAGYSIFLASGTYYLFGKNALVRAAMVLMMVITCYSILTYQRNKVWSDNITLWKDSAAKSFHKVRPHNNLGLAYFDQGDLIQAISEYDEAIKAGPNVANPYINRGIAYAKLGNFNQAMSDFNKSIEISPQNGMAYSNRAILFSQIKDYNNANAGEQKVEIK